MLLYDELIQSANALLDFCEYPAVKYSDLLLIQKVPYEDVRLSALREDFWNSDIVQELYQTQSFRGDWGSLNSKDYSVKAKIPTTTVGIERCLYLGLTLEDKDMLFLAQEHLESYLLGTNTDPLYNKNERAIPWQIAQICALLEAIHPYNELCDRTYHEWHYIAKRAYSDGEYSYERDAAAQHEIFGTREARLIPMQSKLLVAREKELSSELEASMLRHLGGHANECGYFWEKTPTQLPENFIHNKTRRWFATFNYINQFRGSSMYLSHVVEWLLENRRPDGLWDWGTQTKDPWGYFGYYSCNRNYTHNRIVDCTMEILHFLKKYIEKNP